MPSDAWVHSVLSTWDHLPSPLDLICDRVPVVDKHGLRYELSVAQTITACGDTAWTWRAARPCDGVAASGSGLFRIVDAWRALVISASAVRSACRGRGLYTSVLRELRRLAGCVESSVETSPAACAAWRNAGAYVTKRDGQTIWRLA